MKHKKLINTSLFTTLLLAIVMMGSYQSSVASSTPTLLGVTNVRLISQGNNGELASRDSFHPIPSRDGRYIVFDSWDNNWVPQSDNSTECYLSNCMDIFLRDTVAGTTQKISVGFNGSTGNHISTEPNITRDGRYPVFMSYASNLVPGDTNGESEFVDDGIDMFVWDRVTGSMTRTSVDDRGQEINANSVGNISGDGQFLVLLSNGRNVMLGEPNPIHSNIYVINRATGEYEYISQGIDGRPSDDEIYGIMMSDDGRYVSYVANSTNLVAGHGAHNNTHNIFLYDRTTKQTKLVTKSHTGNYPNAQSGQMSFSPEGDYLIFKSDASDIVPNDTNGVVDVFIYTIATEAVERVSLTSTGGETNGLSRDPSICENGRIITFSSDATNIVPGDTNGVRDAFFIDRETGRYGVVRSAANVWGNANTHKSVVTPDCRQITYATDASNLGSPDSPNGRDLFIAELDFPIDCATSGISALGAGNAGQTIPATVTVRNSGNSSAAASSVISLPTGVTFVAGSLTGGATYDATLNQISWSGTAPANGSTAQFGYSYIVDAAVTGPVALNFAGTLTCDGVNTSLNSATIIDGFSLYLPIIFKK